MSEWLICTGGKGLNHALENPGSATEINNMHYLDMKTIVAQVMELLQYVNI